MPGPRRVVIRVLIILSLIWIIGGVTYRLKSQSNEFAQVTGAEQADCIRTTQRTAECSAQAARELSSVDYRKRWVAAAVETAIPLALAWLLVSLGLGVARWMFADGNRS